MFSLTIVLYSHMQPAKLYKLKHLSKVEVVTNDPSGCTFMLVISLKNYIVLTPIIKIFGTYSEGFFHVGL